MPSRTVPALASHPQGSSGNSARVARRELGEEPARRFPEDFVRRPALVRRLIDAKDASLALIVAPPGYGKTAVLTEWAEQDERPFIWVDCGRRSPESVETGAAVLAARARASRTGGRGFVLVFDDAHLVEAELLGEAVRALMSDLPLGATIALASRTEPPIPIGRLRAERCLVELRVRDLTMTQAEAAILLRRAGLELDFGGVQTLVRRTEGWPAALYLAALSLLERPEMPLQQDFRGDDHLLADYLRDEFSSGLSPKLVRFARQTSVLEELTGAACDAVLDQHGTGVTLGRLERLTSLLVPLDNAHTRYRWHGLVREHLKAELRRRQPELEPWLHRAASTWCRGHGDLDGAIAHAVDSGDARHVGDLLWPHILSYTMTARNKRVQGWVSGFSHAAIADYAPLAACAAYSALATGQAAEAQQWGFTAAAALAQDGITQVPDSLQTGLALIQALGARVTVRQMRSLAVQACEVESEGSPWRPMCCLVHGVASHLAGDRADAKRLLEEGADLGVGADPSAAALSLAQLAVIAIEEHDWGLATELSDQANRLIADHALRDAPMSALVFASSAATRAHQGRLDEAKEDLRRGVALLAGPHSLMPWYCAEAHILLGHAALGLADIVGARTLLAEGSRSARRMPGAVIFEHWFEEAWSYMDTLAETSLDGASALTVAELRILRFLPSHRSFREIGLTLGVSANTVKSQAHAIYRKLGAASRSEVVSRASEAGLLGH